VIISAAAVQKLYLQGAFDGCLQDGIEHFPPLISDQCLSLATGSFVKFVESAFRRGRTISPDFIDFPRGRFGVRPIAVSALADRVLYKAPVATIADCLPEPSRSDQNRQAHAAFGPHGDGYVAEVDIVSCYEYVDHTILFEELVTQSLTVESPGMIQEYLTETHGRPLGLPQMSMESDRLADVYLEKMSRALSLDPWTDGAALRRVSEESAF
jgi:hypothetical protein